MGWPITLTAKQSARLIEALEDYHEMLLSAEAPAELRWQVAVVRSVLDRELILGEPELLLLEYILQSLCNELGDDEYDEHLEGAFHKLFGEWPRASPWFVYADQDPTGDQSFQNGRQGPRL